MDIIDGKDFHVEDMWEYIDKFGTDNPIPGLYSSMPMSEETRNELILKPLKHMYHINSSEDRSMY